MKYPNYAVLMVGSLLASLDLAAQEVTLYPEADAQSEPIATIGLGDPRLIEGAPVVDEALAAQGWYWGEFSGEFQGYVPDAKIGKDLLPVEGAFILAAPDADSRILTTVTAEDIRENRIEIIDRGTWWTVSFSKPIPVFYREPVVSAEPVPEPAADDQVRPVAVEPEPVVPPTPTPPEEPSSPPPNEVAPPAEPEAAPAENFVAGTVGTTLRGKLRQAEARFFVFPPPYKFELIDENGERVAYVDFSNAVLQRPISAYLGESVSVFGTWEKVDNLRTIVIRARNLRPDLSN